MLQMEFLIDSRPAYCQILVNPWEVSLYEPEVHLLNLEPVLGAGHRLEDIIEMPDEPVALLEGRLVLFPRLWEEIGSRWPDNHRHVTNHLLDWFHDSFVPRLEEALLKLSFTEREPHRATVHNPIVGQRGLREYQETKFGSYLDHGPLYITAEEHQKLVDDEAQRARSEHVDAFYLKHAATIRDALLKSDLDSVMVGLSEEGWEFKQGSVPEGDCPEKIQRIHESLNIKLKELEKNIPEDVIPSKPTGGIRQGKKKGNKFASRKRRSKPVEGRDEQTNEGVDS